jgi:hypothetical protein
MRGAFLVVLVMLFVAQPAAARELSYEGGVLSYVASPGHVDDISVDLFPTHIVVAARLQDRYSDDSTPAGVNAGPGCAAAPATYGDEPPTLFLCSVIGDPLRRAEVDLGDESDRFAADSTVRVQLAGGAGDDTVDANGRVDGGRGDDALTVVPIGDGFGARRRWLFGGPGHDVLRGGAGPVTLDGGAGRDTFNVAGFGGQADDSRDYILAADGEVDSVNCHAATRTDRLLLDGLDWPHPDKTRACRGLSRSSPPRALPSYVLSPDWENKDGTWVNVYCPHDVRTVCAGTITVKVSGRKLGPVRFRLRPGRDREFKLGRGEYASCEVDVPTRVTVRTRSGGRVLPLTRSLLIDVCPYDSA